MGLSAYQLADEPLVPQSQLRAGFSPREQNKAGICTCVSHARFDPGADVPHAPRRRSVQPHAIAGAVLNHALTKLPLAVR